MINKTKAEYLVEPTQIRQQMCGEYIRYIYPYAMGRDDKKEACAKAIEVLNAISNGESVSLHDWRLAMEITNEALKYNAGHK